MRLILIAALAMTAAPLSAQNIADCGWEASARALAEPWEANTRTYANGDVRLALLDTIEPAAGAFHILVLSPPYDEVGGSQCKTIGVGPGIGFSGADFSRLLADYDPSVGLIFGLPVQLFDGETAQFFDATLGFTLNQNTGEILAAVE